MFAKSLIWNQNVAAAPMMGKYVVTPVRGFFVAQMIHPIGVAIWDSGRLHPTALHAMAVCQQHADGTVAALLDDGVRATMYATLAGAARDEDCTLKLDYLASLLQPA